MIADRLKLARRKAGFSLRDLSAAMNEKVTAQAIGKYERGEDIPSSGVLMALAKALNVSLSYLLDAQGIELIRRRIPDKGEYDRQRPRERRNGGT